MVRGTLALGAGVLTVLIAAVVAIQSYFMWEYGTRSACVVAAQRIAGDLVDDTDAFGLPSSEADEALTIAARHVYDDGGDLACYRVALLGKGEVDLASADGAL